MSMITEQVERLREQAELFREKHYITTYLDEAADTLEMLAAKVREDNVYQRAFEDIRAELTNNHRASERRYWTYYDLMELLDKHNPDKVGKEGKE